LLLKFGIHEVTDELIRQDLVVRVNVGMGNTDPIRRVERLLFGLEKAASLPKMAEKMKPDEAANEIFGSLGYKDASRFFMNEQQLEEKMAQAGDQTPPDVKIKQEEIQIRREDNNLRHQRELMKLDMEAQLGFARLALEKQMTLEKLYATLGMEKQKMLSERQRAAVSNSRSKETERVQERERDMPLTDKGQKIMSSMKSQYGEKKGEQVFYASRNKGRISGVERKGASQNNPLYHGRMRRAARDHMPRKYGAREGSEEY
jgi:hypothetical protein